MVQLPQGPSSRPSGYISSQEQEALRQYALYLWRLYGLQSQCDASDLVQETLCEFCKAIERYRSQGRDIKHRLAYMKKIAFRVCVRALTSRAAEHTLVDNLQNHTSEPEDSSLTGLYRSELLEQIRQLLSDEENELIELRVFQGLEWRKICEHYKLQGKNLNPEKLRKRFERVKLKLANVLIQRGIDSSDL